jgi:cytochrome c oxidase assembly protein subunit 15
VTAPIDVDTGAHRRLRWADSPLALRRLAAASVLVNVLIVITGGAVRLTNSGLGCPTWPRCSSASLIPTERLGIHGAIEFTNRTLTVLVAAVLLLTALLAWRQRTERTLATVALAGVPAQAVLGGIVVLTDLNPWLVALHFLASMALIAVTALLWWRLGTAQVEPAGAPAIALARGLTLVAAMVLVIGTVVTGTGPHAGDLHRGRLHRIALSSAGVAQLHADAVMVLIGLTVGMIALASLGSARRLRRAALVLLGVELAQGVLGYTQYFLHVPAPLVVLHMAGACLVWLAALGMLFTVEPRTSS